MIHYLYEWVQNLAFYMILVTAVQHVLPDNSYKKYIRFFTGLVMVLMLAAPLLEVFDIQEELYQVYGQEERRQREQLEEKMQEYMEKMQALNVTQQEEKEQEETMPKTREGGQGNALE